MPSMEESMREVRDYLNSNLQVTLESISKEIYPQDDFTATFRISNTAVDCANYDVGPYWLHPIVVIAQATEYAIPLSDDGDEVSQRRYDPAFAGGPLRVGESFAITIPFKALGAKPNIRIAEEMMGYKDGTVYFNYRVEDPPEPFVRLTCWGVTNITAFAGWNTEYVAQIISRDSMCLGDDRTGD
jgi:hypothetical protein